MGSASPRPQQRDARFAWQRTIDEASTSQSIEGKAHATNEQESCPHHVGSSRYGQTTEDVRSLEK
eukprot:1696971-Pyramimonas_sp.AAC.1